MQLPLSGSEAVEEVLAAFPAASLWLYKRGIICVQCGEVFWGSLAELCQYRGIDGQEFEAVILGMNEFLQRDDHQPA